MTPIDIPNVRKLPRWLPPLLTGLTTAVALLATSGNYGLGLDNPADFRTLPHTLDYLLRGDDSLLRFANSRYYGPPDDVVRDLMVRLFHDALGWVELVTARRLHLYAFAGATVALLTWIGSRVHNSLGLLAGGLLLAHPLYFGYAHLSQKDIPLAFLVLVAAYGIYRWTETGRPGSLYGAAIAAGVGFAVKFTVVLLGPVALIYRGLRIPDRPLPGCRSLLAHAAGALGVAWATATLCWPYLWFNPLRVWEIAWYFVHQYRWGGLVLFQGHVYNLSRESLPGYYFPWMMTIKSPLLHLTGIALSGGWFVRKTLGGRAVHPLLQWAGVGLIVPLALVTLFSRAQYDAPRQLVFLLPFLCLLAAWGWWRLWRTRFTTGLVASALLLLYLGVHWAGLHPNEIVFYNALVGGERGAAGRYELDFYGNAYRQGARWLNRRSVANEMVYVPVQGNVAAPFLRDGIAVTESPDVCAEWALVLPRGGHDPFADREPAVVLPEPALPVLRIYRLREHPCPGTDHRSRDGRSITPDWSGPASARKRTSPPPRR